MSEPHWHCFDENMIINTSEFIRFKREGCEIHGMTQAQLLTWTFDNEDITKKKFELLIADLVAPIFVYKEGTGNP